VAAPVLSAQIDADGEWTLIGGLGTISVRAHCCIVPTLAALQSGSDQLLSFRSDLVVERDGASARGMRNQEMLLLKSKWATATPFGLLN
jgi:hypothetical protein